MSEGAAKKAEELKNKGNEAFHKKEYALALLAYSEGLSILTNNNAILHGNRSATYLKLDRPLEALEDACAAILDNPSWDKGYYHHGNALLALGRSWEARHSFARALQLSPSSTQFSHALEVAEKAYIDKYFREATKQLIEGSDKVEVRYINRARGKGVFAKESFGPGESLFVEIPLASHLLISQEDQEVPLMTCSRCMATQIQRDQVPAPLMGVYERISEGKTPFVTCEKCTEVYCSETCKTQAWQEYHEILCVNEKLEPEHPIAKYNSLARLHDRTNPLVILRIFAMVFQLVKNKGYEIRKAFEPFANFVSHEEPIPDDNIFMELIEKHFFSSHCDAELKEEIFNLSTFRHLNGAIHQNAQTISPVSDFHTFLAESEPSEQARLIHSINALLPIKETYDTVYHFMASPMMRRLTINGGSGLFVIANSMNHSCAPNVIVVSCFNSFKVRVMALREISPNDELCFSYINENLPFAERQKQLLELYLFSCSCPKCVQEKAKVK